jgi:hypothetical protein
MDSLARVNHVPKAMIVNGLYISDPPKSRKTIFLADFQVYEKTTAIAQKSQPAESALSAQAAS